MDDIRGSVHGIDSWWTRYFIDPLAFRLAYLIANFSRISPNTVTLITFPIIFVSAYFFFVGKPFYLIIGAFIYEFNFALDCVDGKLARVTGQTSKFGAFFDLYLDNFNVFINLFALTYGQYRITGNDKFLIICILYLFVHITQQLNKYLALHILGGGFKDKFYFENDLQVKKSFPKRIKSFFAKKKLNIVLFTTVEGEAFVFFFGPITGYVFESIFIALILVSIFFALKTIFFMKSCIDLDKESRGSP